MGILNTISDLIDRSDFAELWENNDRGGIYRLCNDIRIEAGVRPYSLENLEEGWQYRTILHANFEIAKEEFLNFIFGWW